MSQIRLYVDEDALNSSVVDGLRRLGFDLLTVAENGELGQPDERHLDQAVMMRRVFYTLNTRHFTRLHRDYLATGRHHSGIITIVRQRYSIGEKVRRIADFIDSTTAEEMIDCMEFL